VIKPLIRKALGHKTLGAIDYFRSPGFKNRFGGPFNGQEFRRRIFLELLDLLQPRAISLRQISDDTFQPSAHLANDKGGLVFEVHWDPTSTSLSGKSRIHTGNSFGDFVLEQLMRKQAGEAHGNVPLTPAQVRQNLKLRRLVPIKE